MKQFSLMLLVAALFLALFTPITASADDQISTLTDSITPGTAVLVEVPVVTAEIKARCGKFFMACWSRQTWATVGLFVSAALPDTAQTSGKYGFLAGPSFACANVPPTTFQPNPPKTGICTPVEGNRAARDTHCVAAPGAPRFWINLGCTLALFGGKAYVLDPLMSHSKVLADIDFYGTTAAIPVYYGTILASNEHLLNAQHGCQPGQYWNFIPGLSSSGKCISLSK